MQTSLAEMSHPQPSTPLETDKIAENSIVNRTEKQKIQSNRHEILLGTRQNKKQIFPHILVRRK